MSRINPYSAATAAYQPVTRRPDNAAAQTPVVKPTAQAGATAVTASAEGLTQAERQLINRYFPDAPDLSLRLYGPNRDARTLNPAALGSRLDLRG